jgi:hypothetical protein
VNDYKPDIWRLQFQSNIDGLTAALTNDDPDIRKRAAAALRTLGAASAIPTLKTVIETESDPDARAHILAALDYLANEAEAAEKEPSAEVLEQNRVSRLIAELNRQESPERIIEAARELGELDDKLAGEPLVMVFNNTKLPLKVRLTVAETLLKLECAPMEVSLLGALRNSDWHIRHKAAAVLGKMKADWAVPPLSKALYDEHKQVRRTAGAALRHINTPEAQAALRTYIRAWKTGSNVIKPAPSAKPKAQQKPAPTAKPTPPAKPEVPQKPASTAKPVAEKPEAPDQAVPPKKRTGLRARLDANAAKTDSPPDVDPTSPTVEVPRSKKKPAADPNAPTVEVPKTGSLDKDKPSAAPATVAPETKTEFQPPKQTAKLAWPKRKPSNTSISIAPTAPLDPKKLEDARDRFNRAASGADTPAEDVPDDDKSDDES